MMSLLHSLSSCSAPTGAPKGVNITRQDETSITVQWNEVLCLEQNSEITQYIVQYSEDTSSRLARATDIMTVNVPTRSLIITELNSGKLYTIRVAAVNSAGEMGPFSDAVTAESKCSLLHALVAKSKQHSHVKQ